MGIFRDKAACGSRLVPAGRAESDRWLRMGVVGVLMVAGGCGRGSEPAKEAPATAPAAGTHSGVASPGYDYGRTSALACTSAPSSNVEASMAQWPRDPAAQMRAMHERLERVCQAISQAAGTAFVPRLEQTGRGAVLHQDGTVSVDPTALWRLSEDGLAALLARAAAEAALDSGASPASSGRGSRQVGHPAATLPNRGEVLAIDESAGRIARQAGFGPEGLSELFRHKVGVDVSLGGFVGGESQRIDSFKRGHTTGLPVFVGEDRSSPAQGDPG